MPELRVQQKTWTLDRQMKSNDGTVVKSGTIGVRAISQVRLANGCTLTVKSPGQVGFREGDTVKLDQAYEQERERLEEAIDQIPGISSTREPQLPAPDRVDDLALLRTQLLRDALPGTNHVFDLVERIAGCRGAIWAYSTEYGFRCSVSNRLPTLTIQDTEQTSSRVTGWANDGSYDCLCPLALIWDVEHDDLTNEGPRDVHNDPYRELQRRIHEATGVCLKDDLFTMETAPWAMLVLASDNALLQSWIDTKLEPLDQMAISAAAKSDRVDQHTRWAEAAAARRAALDTTLDRVRLWMLATIAPSPADELRLAAC